MSVTRVPAWYLDLIEHFDEGAGRLLPDKRKPVRAPDDHDPKELPVADLAAFQRAYPAYEGTLHLDELRAREYARLDAQGQVYLDYTGGGLFAECQLREYAALLQSGVFGNPHSVNPTSRAATALIEHARQAVLAFFNAPADEYAVVFTANASAALKLVGEAYPVSAAYSRAGPRWLSYDGPGSPAARSASPRCRAAAGTTCCLARPASKMARSTTSAFPQWRSACGTWSEWAWRSFTSV